MPRAFTDQEKKNIRLKLIESGKIAFGQYGIKKTGIEDLAKMAGISKGAFYQFYPSKEDLYFAVIRQYETGQHQYMHTLLKEKNESERKLLKTVIKNIMDQVDHDPFVRRLLGKEEFDYLWQKFTPEKL